jgi:hypothetical protein
MFTLSGLLAGPAGRNLRGDMSELEKKARRVHRHKAVIAHALRQHGGIPYEIEQRVCSGCRRVLDERTVRRATA